MSSALNGYFTGIRKANRNAFSQVFEQTTKIICTTYLLSLFLPNGLEYACLALVLGETISEIASFFFAYLLYLIESRRLEMFRHSISFKKQILSISLPVAFTSYLRSGLSTLKQILIPLRLEKFGMSCEYAISNYGIISGMVMPTLLFPSAIINSFSSLLIPEFSAYRSLNRTSAISSIISKVFHITLVFSIGVIGIFLFYGDEISNILYPNAPIGRILKNIISFSLFNVS